MVSCTKCKYYKECKDELCGTDVPLSGCRGYELGYLNVVLDEGVKMPTRAHEYDAGLDIYSRETIVVPAKESAVFDTGVHIEIPEGYVGMLKSKSGLNVKHGITSEGVIDAGYT